MLFQLIFQTFGIAAVSILIYLGGGALLSIYGASPSGITFFTYRIALLDGTPYWILGIFIILATNGFYLFRLAVIEGSVGQTAPDRYGVNVPINPLKLVAINFIVVPIALFGYVVVRGVENNIGVIEAPDLLSSGKQFLRELQGGSDAAFYTPEPAIITTSRSSSEEKAIQVAKDFVRIQLGHSIEDTKAEQRIMPDGSVAWEVEFETEAGYILLWIDSETGNLFDYDDHHEKARQGLEGSGSTLLPTAPPPDTP